MILRHTLHLSLLGAPRRQSPTGLEGTQYSMNTTSCLLASQRTLLGHDVLPCISALFVINPVLGLMPCQCSGSNPRPATHRGGTRGPRPNDESPMYLGIDKVVEIKICFNIHFSIFNLLWVGWGTFSACTETCMRWCSARMVPPGMVKLTTRCFANCFPMKLPFLVEVFCIGISHWCRPESFYFAGLSLPRN